MGDGVGRGSNGGVLDGVVSAAGLELICIRRSHSRREDADLTFDRLGSEAPLFVPSYSSSS